MDVVVLNSPVFDWPTLKDSFSKVIAELLLDDQLDVFHAQLCLNFQVGSS